jgi:hypothetical protein
MLTALAWLLLPLQLASIFILGILVSLSRGLLAWPLHLTWVVLRAPLVGASWACSRREVLRDPVGVLGIPWAILAYTYLCLMPSKGKLEGRAAELLLVEVWPFSWEFRRFQTGALDPASAAAGPLREVLERASRDEPIKQWTIDGLARSYPRSAPPHDLNRGGAAGDLVVAGHPADSRAPAGQ